MHMTLRWLKMGVTPSDRFGKNDGLFVNG
jgi:hypothetical protein